MSNGFWQNNNQPQQPVQEMVLDEQALAEIQGEEFDIYEDEEEDTASLMLDANLRLEQGRLYQMVMQNDIFADTNADPRAIKNVQREIRKYVRERMETMLGIRQEVQAQIQEKVISSPFNDMEVTALKMVASKVTNGASQAQQSQSITPISTPQAPAKKDGITAISGVVKTNTPTPTKAAPKPSQKQPQKAAAPRKERSGLSKPVDQMSPQELAEHDKMVAEEQSRLKATAPNLAPHPNPQQLEIMYSQIAGNSGLVMAGSGGWRPY